MDAKDIDVSLANPFLGAAYDVFKQLFQVELQKGAMVIKSNPSSDHEVAIIIGVSGDKHTGVVVYSMKEFSAKKIVNTLDPSGGITENSESFADALGELANMISGNAMAAFSKKGTPLTITTPSVVVGTAFEMHLLDQTTLSIDMSSPFGKLEINVAIKKY